MKTALLGAVLAVTTIATPLVADDRRTLGWGRLFTNDYIGDGEDRWRSGSYAVSNVRGKTWTGELPTTFGEIIEYRFRSEIIAPSNITSPAADDRRYVGALSIGAHTHFQRGGNEMNVGLDLIMVGPQTKLSDFQEELHDLVGAPTPRVDGFEVDNAVYPHLTFEIARTIPVGAKTRVRPFLELQAGAETMARVGGDITFGDFGIGGLPLRDVSTGQRYSGINSDEAIGLSLMIGADLAYVADSQFLDTPGVVSKDVRGRVRVGLYQGWNGGGIFYGATFLSEEFEAQSEGQVLGSLNVRFSF